MSRQVTASGGSTLDSATIMTSTTDAIKLGWGRLDWLALLALAVLVLLFHWQLITPNLADRHSYQPGDFSHQFWAFTTFERQELATGRLPLWNPYTFAGSPFWADVQSAVFYPFSLLTVLWSIWTSREFSLFALEWEAIFHFWLGGLFMYLLVRRLTQHRAAGWISALIFVFGGYLTGYPSQQLAVLEVDVWLPLILFFIDRALIERQPGQAAVRRERANLPDWVLAGLVWGVAILAGHPQSWLLVGYTFSAYFLFLVLWGGRIRASIRALLPWLGIVAIGLGVAAIQLFPAIEYTRLSVRAEGVYDRMSGGLALIDPIQLLLPGVVSAYSPLYVGLLGLLLVVVALFYMRQRFTIFWGIWGAFAFLISFGGETFLYSPLYLFGPGFSIFRGQERWVFVFALSAAVLAGYGAKALFVWGNNRRHPDLVRWGSWLLVGGLILVIIFFYGLNEAGWSTQSQFYDLLNAAILLVLLAALTQMIIRIAIGNQFRPTVLLLGMSAIILFDLFTVNWQNNLHPQPPELQTQPPDVIAALKADAATSDGLFRVYNEFRIYDNYGIPFQVQDMWGASPLRLAAYEAFVSPPMLIERAWAMLNVKYVITWREELFAPSTILYQEAAADGATYLHRLEMVGPRAWLVHVIEPVPSEQMVSRMAADFDLRQVALLDPAGPLPPIEPAIEDQDQVTVVDFAPDHITLRVEAGSAGLLVLSEIDYPGWQATIDGEPVAILPANSILRAVPLAAGTHEVVFTFRPLTFQLGATISALTVGGAVVALLLTQAYRRRQRV